jgi:hypothetical protein
MVARHWRGWTEARNADAYESLLKIKVLPALKRLAGYQGGYILRSDVVKEVEFVVIVPSSIRLRPFGNSRGPITRCQFLNPKHGCFYEGLSRPPSIMRCVQVPFRSSAIGMLNLLGNVITQRIRAFRSS